MSYSQLSQMELQSLLYPQGTGAYYFGNTPVNYGMATGRQAPAGSVTPSGNVVQAGTAPAAGTTNAGMAMPSGASSMSTNAQIGNVASMAVGAAGDIASDYIDAQLKAELIRSQKPIPNNPEGYAPALANISVSPMGQQQNRKPIYG